VQVSEGSTLGDTLYPALEITSLEPQETAGLVTVGQRLSILQHDFLLLSEWAYESFNRYLCSPESTSSLR
jgi:hypothetical protein